MVRNGVDGQIMQEGERMPKYREIGKAIEAVQRTDSNNNELKELCGKEFRTDRGGAIYIGDYQSYHRIEVGDFVVKSSTGSFYVLSEETMKAKYEEVT